MNSYSHLSDENFLDMAKNKVKTEFELELLERIYKFRDSFDVLWEESYNKEEELNNTIGERDERIAELEKEIVELEAEISIIQDDLLKIEDSVSKCMKDNTKKFEKSC